MRCAFRSVRAWAYDLPTYERKGGAPKRYIAASVAVFSRAYSALAPAMRNAYEIIEASRPCWPYFDLEFARDEPTNVSSEAGTGINRFVDGDAMTQLVIQTCSTILNEEAMHKGPHGSSGGANEARKEFVEANSSTCDAVLQCQGTLETDVIVLDSHRSTKFSRHLILRPHMRTSSGRTPLPLNDSATAGLLARTVCQRLGSAIQVEPPRSAATSNTSASFVDLGVYTRSRCFRLIGSSKRGMGSPAVLSWNEKLSVLGVGVGDVGVADLASQLRETLVVPELLGFDETKLGKLSLASLRNGHAPSKLHNKPQQQEISGELNGAANQPEQPRAVSTDVVPPLMPVEEWVNRCTVVTPSPLLDFASSAPQHPFIRCMLKGSGSPPSPFKQLGDWAVRQFNEWPNCIGGTPCSVKHWKYVRSEHPTELLLHLTANGTRYCFARGRQHRSQRVMISFDLLQRHAWQRCWDPDCEALVSTADASTRMKAKHELARPPPDVAPSLPIIMEFEGHHYWDRSYRIDEAFEA